MSRRKINATWMAAALWAFAASACFAAEPAPSPRLWMVPMDQFKRSGVIPGTPDYMRLFEEPPDPAWGALLPHVAVWKLYYSFAVDATDAQLRTVFNFVKAHRIALALEWGSLTTGKYCEGKTEGFGGERLPEIARHFARLGGRIDYLAMDEPLFYGHHDTFNGGCRAPIATLAADMATNLAALRAVFPDVRVGDIEPAAATGGDWAGEIAEFFDAFRAAFGENLAFFHLDVDWSVEWEGSLRRLAARAGVARVPLGVIYNGTGADGDDRRWAAHVEENYTLVEDALGGSPADAVLQSWERWPTRALPVASPDTATGILARYLRARAAFEARREDDRTVAGVLTIAGSPAPGRAVTLEARGLGDDTASLTIAGRIPPGASRALLAARFNAECDCSGSATLRLGPARYRDEGGREAIRSFAAFRGPGLSPGANAVGDRLLRVEAAPGRIMSFNTLSFPVTPGSPFEASFALSMDPVGDRVGYVAVIYLDERDHEVTRTVRLAESAWGEVAKAMTDGLGRFGIAVPTGAAREQLRLRYPGNGDARPAIDTLP